MRAHKVDANQQEIVKAFRDLGYSVHVTSRLGEGFPDIVCGKYERNYLIEIKDGSKPLSQQKLTEPEEKFASSWRGQYSIIGSCDDVIRFNAEQWGRV